MEKRLQAAAGQSKTQATDQGTISAPSSQASKPSETTGGVDHHSEWQTVEQLLAQPGHRPLMREVPRLSPETESTLIDLYRQIRAPSDKHHIVRILAFGGGSAAAATLLNAVTNEYSGVKLAIQDHAILWYIPNLLGVLARQEGAAFEFLVKGSHPEFWQPFHLFQNEKGESPTICSMAGACIKGLALTGRIEAVQMIEYYRNHPEAAHFAGGDGAVICQFDGSVVDAAFTLRIVSERGLDTVMDEVFYDFEQAMREFRNWHDSTEGFTWRQWASAAGDATRARLNGAGKASGE